MSKVLDRIPADTTIYTITTRTAHGRLMSRLIRAAIGDHRAPIEMGPGDAPPKIVGERWHFRTRGGRYISHPSAYSKFGWSNMVYHSSSRRIEVGREWVAKAVADSRLSETQRREQAARLGAVMDAILSQPAQRDHRVKFTSEGGFRVENN